MRTTIILLCLMALPGHAEDISTIRITVVDAETGEPVAGARVNANGGSWVTTRLGAALIPAGISVITVDHPAYQPQEYQLPGTAVESIEVQLQRRVFGDTIVISGAARRDQSIADSPIFVESLGQEQNEIRNPQTAADLLGEASGVYVQKSQMGGGSPMIRGFSTSRVLIVVDGIRMNNAIFRSGNVHNVISLDPLAIDRTEVVYGPGSVIYGSDAIGGVMSFETHLPEFSVEELQTSGHLFTRANSANSEFTGNLGLDAAGQRWALTLSGTRSDFGDLRMGSQGFPEYRREWYVVPSANGDRVVENPDPDVQRFTGYQQNNFSGKFAFKLSPDMLVTAGVYHSETSDIPRYDRLIERRGGQPRSAQWYYGPQRWQVAWLRLDHSADSRFFDSVRFTFSQQLFEESRHDRSFGSSNLRHRTESVDAWAVSADFDKDFGPGFSLYYGAELITNTVGSIAWQENIRTGSRQAISTRYPDGSTWDSIAAYASGIYRVNDRLTLTAGFRATSVEIEGTLDRRFFPFPFEELNLSTSNISGSFGMTYALGSDLMLFANLGSGFRAPNIDDVAKVFDSEPGAVVVPNPDLDSERVVTADSGLLYLLSGGGRVRLNVYYTTLYDAMVRRDSTFAGQEFILYDGELSRVQAIVNADSATVWGVESSLEVPLTPWLLTKAAFTYTDGETDSGDPLRHVAPSFGSLSARILTGSLVTDVTAQWNGEISADDLAPSERGKPHIYALDEDGRPYAPSWWRIDIRSLYSLNQRLTLSFGIENLFDERYRPYSSGITAAGRSFFAAIRQTF